MSHSTIVGGSTAKRVINCPASVALVAKMPPQLESEVVWLKQKYALLHTKELIDEWAKQRSD